MVNTESEVGQPYTVGCDDPPITIRSTEESTVHFVFQRANLLGQRPETEVLFSRRIEVLFLRKQDRDDRMRAETALFYAPRPMYAGKAMEAYYVSRNRVPNDPEVIHDRSGNFIFEGNCSAQQLVREMMECVWTDSFPVLCALFRGKGREVPSSEGGVLIRHDELRIHSLEEQSQRAENPSAATGKK